MSRIVVYTKPGCHLCEDACAAVSRIAAETSTTRSAQDISADEALMAQWAEYVPVILVDNEVHGWFRVDDKRLRAALS